MLWHKLDRLCFDALAATVSEHRLLRTIRLPRDQRRCCVGTDTRQGRVARCGRTLNCRAQVRIQCLQQCWLQSLYAHLFADRAKPCSLARTGFLVVDQQLPCSTKAFAPGRLKSDIQQLARHSMQEMKQVVSPSRMPQTAERWCSWFRSLCSIQYLL